jgi:hypothetical protein
MVGGFGCLTINLPKDNVGSTGSGIAIRSAPSASALQLGTSVTLDLPIGNAAPRTATYNMGGSASCGAVDVFAFRPAP